MYRATASLIAIALAAPAYANEKDPTDERQSQDGIANPSESIIVIGGRIDAYEVAGAADLIDGEELSEFEHGDVSCARCRGSTFRKRTVSGYSRILACAARRSNGRATSP